ncbi:hypothetical protein EUGRSUZ_B03525 [Eucalyptus grandis]|uniref:OTU domain-containing protein n=2 Tax=Eucalyptus grandis TaxID=71139 RepID=A0A059D8B7_EUCGR|nr:hypothetical protein EUGRSUZ_B03525 [Eucalyptus grandis]
MGKLLCDSAAVAETFPAPTSTAIVPWMDADAESLDSIPAVELSDHHHRQIAASWDDVVGLEDQQRRRLQRLRSKGVLWRHPHDKDAPPVVFCLSHGGEVSADGNCLFTASLRATTGGAAARGGDARDLRRRVVGQFLEGLGSATGEEKEKVEDAIRHMYSPDLKSGWGVHVVQEVKLLTKKEDRVALDSAIEELAQIGMQREMAAESIYKERCIPVNDGSSWAKYMSISGSSDDEYDIITLQYTEEGLLYVEENREGHAAAFGDDIAIECLATEFDREIFVVQAHGSDAMVDEDSCIFFLPHRPRSQIRGPPLFLFMKGTGWCGAGADHYEPLIAHPASLVSPEKVAAVL